jgi:hypothetical protein
MALPDDFNPFEHLQNVFRMVYNRQVRAEFRDLGGDDWDDDISTPRGSLRVACTMTDNDNLGMMFMRVWLFYVMLRKAQDFHPAIYGIPTPSYQEARRFKPQIQLYFQEDYGDIEPGYAPVTAEISFRLMNETHETLVESEARVLANKIETLFASGSGYTWQKGKVQCTYTDQQRGYALRLLARNKAEGRRVIEQILDIQNHTPDWKKMNVSENEDATSAYPTIPDRELIFGKSRRLPRQRPIATVRFQYALLHVWGMPHPVVLVDRSRIFREQLAS